jgi:hypothetical protein
VVDPPQRKSGQPTRQQLRGGLDLVARYSFTPDGENLIVECWIGAGGGLPEHLHPRQEERWSMMLGRIRLGLGHTKREIGPAEPRNVGGSGHRALTEERQRGGGAAALPCPTGARASVRPGGKRGGGARRPLHARRHTAQPARRKLGGALLKRHRADVMMSFPPRPVQSAMIALLGRSS